MDHEMFAGLRTLTSRRVLRFGLVGGSASVIYYLLLFIGVDILQMGATLASSITYLVVITYNYFMHYSWTFASSLPHRAAVQRFLLMNAVGFCINAVIMFAGVGLMHFNYLLIQTVAIAAVIVWNYCMYSLWVFRH